MIRKLKIINRQLYSSGKIIHNNKYKLPKRHIGFKKPLLIGFSIFIVSMVMYKNKPKQLQFILQKNQLNKQIIKKNKYFNIQQYAPTIYLSFAPWMQLIQAKYFETHKNIKLKQEKIGSSSLYYVGVHDKLDKDKKTACVVVIGGSQKLNYTMEHLMHYISSNRFETIGVVVQDIHDQKQLENVINQIKKSRKNQNFYAVGLEYGANLLVKTSALNPTLFKSIVSIGNPLNLQIAQKRVSQSWGAKQTYLPNMIKGRLQSKNIQKASDLNLYNVDKILYKIESDEKLRQLKQKNSSINYLSKIKVPTLLLNSKQDDFSIQFNSNQSQQLEESISENPLVMSILTQNGGHNEWFYNLKAYRWMPSAVISHLKIIDKIFTQQPQLLKTQ